MSIAPKKLAILVSGGPAPGINSVIGAATIRAEVEGIEVLGIKDGFQWIMEGETTHVKELNIHNVSRIHFRGGSFIGISRANPTKDDKHLENTVTSLLRLDVDKLITIGGDDTAFSALKVNEVAAGRIKVVHVPKTIDNDLDLPHGIPTFGFQTARHIGVEIVKSLMVDAQTTSRWYFIISMGRKAGHLALGIGKATGATLTLVPEEFPGESIDLNHVADVLVGSIIKRLSYGKSDGVAILAEGIVERLKHADLDQLVDIERDAHDNIRIAEVNFGEILKMKVQQKLKEYGTKVTVVAKNIGYELRCADPIPFDMEYTRDLGFSASQFLLDGGSGAMISIQNGRFVPLYFKDILDPVTKRTKVRMIDPSSESFYIARKYMLRLNKIDFEDPNELAKLAATANLSIDNFKKKFYYLIENDLMYKHLEDGNISFNTTDRNIAHKVLSSPKQNGEAID